MASRLNDFLAAYPENDNPHRTHVLWILRKIKENEAAKPEDRLPLRRLRLDPEWLRTKTEYVAWRLEAGMYGFGGGLSFFTLRRRHLVWETLRGGVQTMGPEISGRGSPFLGYAGTALGVPFHIGDDGRSEIRLMGGLLAGEMTQEAASESGDETYRSYGPFLLAEAVFLYHQSAYFAWPFTIHLVIPGVPRGDGWPHPTLGAGIGFRI